MILLERSLDAIQFPSFQTMNFQIPGYLNIGPKTTVWSGSKENAEKALNKRNMTSSCFYTLRLYFPFYLIKDFFLGDEKLQWERDLGAHFRPLSKWQSQAENHYQELTADIFLPLCTPLFWFLFPPYWHPLILFFKFSHFSFFFQHFIVVSKAILY